MDRLAALLDFLCEDPADPFTRFAIAQEYAKLGRDADAAEAYEALVRDRPDYVGTYYHLGALYRRLSRPADAEATLRAGIATATAAGDAHARAELQRALLDDDL